MAAHGCVLRRTAALLALAVCLQAPVWAASKKTPKKYGELSARSAIVVDALNGDVLFSKNPKMRLPQASTTKLMTAVLALEHLPISKPVRVSARAASVEPSKAGLTLGAEYSVRDLVKAALVASSNDAAIVLAEAVAGSEAKFAELMNRKALKLGMKDTCFINATGLPDPKRAQYSTAYDLSILMRYACRDRRIDAMMGMTAISLRGSDGRRIDLKSHNKMLWKTPGFVKGKTGWTFASRHTFVGTDYRPEKKIHFAMLSSAEPWTDIERLATLGHARRQSKTA